MKLSSWSICHAGTRPALPGNFVASSRRRTSRPSAAWTAFYVDSIAGGNCVLGNFVDASYRTYLMFVNEDYISSRNFTVTLDARTSKGLGRVDKSTGKLVLTYIRVPGSYTMLCRSRRATASC